MGPISGIAQDCKIQWRQTFEKYLKAQRYIHKINKQTNKNLIPFIVGNRGPLAVRNCVLL